MERKRKINRRNKGGRPKKGAADKLKYRLTVKMATSDYYTLKDKTRSVGISVGEFLRRCMRDGQVKERLRPEHTSYVCKLCGMANNLNQLAIARHFDKEHPHVHMIKIKFCNIPEADEYTNESWNGILWKQRNT